VKFSIIHASARPDEWEASALAYYHNASCKHEIEYILVTEPSVKFDTSFTAKDFKVLKGITPKSSVAHWNYGASKATGDVIILNSDDMFPPKVWDILIADAFLNTGKYVQDDPMVVRVGYTNEAQQGLMTLQVMSRAYYRLVGNPMYPGFQSVYADNDFTACAEELEAVIEAPLIEWEHRHPIFTGKEMDEVYKTENEPIRYTYGRQLFEFRKRFGYKALLGLEPKKAQKTKSNIVALCTPGKDFGKNFLFEYGQLVVKCFNEGGIIIGHSVTHHSVHTSRIECVEAVNSIEGLKPDYYFWVDSDQEGFLGIYDQLKGTLDNNPEIDVVAAYTYMKDGCINAGFFYKEPNGDLMLNKGHNSFKSEAIKVGRHDRFYGELFTSVGDDTKPIKVDWVGFGCVLMRAKVIEQLAPDVFTPIYFYKDKVCWVMDDTGFCLRCLDRGIQVYLDPKAYVRHMKLLELQPSRVETMKGGE
jgi:hypothetical protein